MRASSKACCLIWREGDDSIYEVPLRTPSPAHVIAASAVVRRRPIHGLDVDGVSAYLAALENARLPGATLSWWDPEHGRIVAPVADGQVVSLQNEL